MGLVSGFGVSPKEWFDAVCEFDPVETPQITEKIEIVYHEEHEEYEAYIPSLGRHVFTFAGSTPADAVQGLQDLYPSLIADKQS